MVLPNYMNRLDDGEALLLGVIMLLLQRGADPFLKRRCPEHPSDLEHSEECAPACSLTGCSIGIRSRYLRVRQHFGELWQLYRIAELASSPKQPPTNTCSLELGLPCLESIVYPYSLEIKILLPSALLQRLRRKGLTIPYIAVDTFATLRVFALRVVPTLPEMAGCVTQQSRVSKHPQEPVLT
jgi:hypothetical protein